MKRLQNRIAESTLTLPFMGVVLLLTWLLAGGVGQRWWPQLGCYVATVYLMVELSNSNALLRVRSRMVSGVFIGLSCTACFLFASLPGSVVQLCYVATLLLLFHTYQNPQAVGLVYYAFLCQGVACLLTPQLLVFVPLLWLLMATQLQSLSWRLLLTSLLGLFTPAWLALAWLLFVGDLSLAAAWLDNLTTLTLPYAEGLLTLPQLLSLVLVVVLGTAGVVHFWHKSFEDKTRVRLLLGFLVTMAVASVVCLLLQPHLYDPLLRLVVVSASPLVAHFFTFTHTRLTNIAFLLTCAAVVALTVYNLLWMPSSLF